MTVPRDLTGRGVPEAEWERSAVLATLPRQPERALWAGVRRVVVVAPHPDDEVLGAGGLLALAAARGLPVLVVGVTDGEASHPGSSVVTPAALVARRREERLVALGRLGIEPAVIVRCGLPDGAVADHVATLTVLLRRLVRPGDLLVGPLGVDGHPDHDACGAATAAVGGTRRASYAVWLWHWASPTDWPALRPGAVRLELPGWVRRAKDAAVAAFTSQIEPWSPDPADAPVLPDAVLRRLTRSFETLWWPT